MASCSVRAHRLTSSPLLAKTTPSVFPQVVVPIIAILDIYYPLIIILENRKGDGKDHPIALSLVTQLALLTCQQAAYVTPVHNNNNYGTD